MTAVLELISVRASQLAFERNGASFGSIAASMANGTFKWCLKEAKEWTENAVKVMRSANDVTFESDEDAAKYILQKLYEKHPKLKGRKSIIP